jgi:hypothetical protein
VSRPADLTALLLEGFPPVPVSLPPFPAGGAPAAEDGKGLARSSAKSGARDERSEGLALPEFWPVLRRPSRERRRSNLANRAWAWDTGLSNPAYLAAASGTQFLRVQIESARVKFTFSDPVAESLTPVDGVGGKRGEITCLSDAARERLANRAWALGAEGHEPEVMVTLTAPANWERVYICDEDGQPLGGGRLLKAHLAAFRKRLERFLKRHGVPSWSALWFLEFQRRGAPHVHLLLFGCKLPERVRRALRNWCGGAWSSIVGNPDRLELAKHRRAGTQVARMKCAHFGYAVKYAAKTEQKEVPHQFRDVGRFWGCWNYTSPEPVVLDFDYSRLNPDETGWVRRLLWAVIGTIHQHSPAFAMSRISKAEEALQSGLKYKFSFTVYGPPARAAALSLFS